MLSYQHGFHAGCFADVVKHITLSHLLSYMTKKEQPLVYIDTHAGRGQYDLKHTQSKKTGEAQRGIEAFMAHAADMPKILHPYLRTIQAQNPDGALRYYPGSPDIALQYLRPQDRAVFCELHPTEYKHLEALPSRGQRVFTYHQDGFECLAANLPPIERRGLIFIDPSYEQTKEYRELTLRIQQAYRRFATGVYCVWYPLIDRKSHQSMIRELSMLSPQHLRIEFSMTPMTHKHMYGCGLFVINPPYLLHDQMKQSLDVLMRYLNPGVSSYALSCSGEK